MLHQSHSWADLRPPDPNFDWPRWLVHETQVKSTKHLQIPSKDQFHPSSGENPRMLLQSRNSNFMVRWRQHNIILQLQLCISIPLKRLEIHHQIILDSEDSVCRQVGVVFGEYLRRDRDVAVAADHQMNMCRAHGVAIEEIQENACGA